MSFLGKSYVVFGAASGLGQATAVALMQRGARVVVSDVSAERLAETTQLLGTASHGICADVSNIAQVRAVMAEAGTANAPLHGVVNTAGILHGQRLLGRGGVHDPVAFEHVIRVNLIGSFNVMACAAEVLSSNTPDVDGERGVIVNTASVAAFDGQGGNSRTPLRKQVWRG
jgi:NAD(P)-dependent dehydrogenase (short-subunit alcohol dehydrogenase family)